MPSKSQKQHNLMAAVAHGWKPDRIDAPPVSVAKEYAQADQAKAKKMAHGGVVSTVDDVGAAQPRGATIPLPPGTKEDDKTILVPKPEGGYQRFVKELLPKGLLNRLVFVDQRPQDPQATLVSPITGQPLDEATQKEHRSRLQAEDFDAQLANLIEASAAPEWPGKTQAIEEIKQRIARTASMAKPAGEKKPEAPPAREEPAEELLAGERALNIPEQALLDVGVAPSPRVITPMQPEVRPPLEQLAKSASGEPQFRRRGFPGEPNELMSATTVQRDVDRGTIDPEELPETPVEVIEKPLPTQPVIPNFKVLEETPDHFRVQKDGGPPFKVAKAGISSRLLSKIQAFAKGGEVGADPPGTQTTGEGPDAQADDSTGDAFMDSLLKGWETVKDDLTPKAERVHPLFQPVREKMVGGLQAIGVLNPTTPPAAPVETKLPEATMPPAPPQELVPDLPLAPEQQTTTEMAPQMPQVQQGQSASVSASGPVAVNYNTGTVGRIEQGLKQQEQAIKAQMDAEVARAQAMEQVQAEQALKMRAMEQEATKQVAEHQMLADQAAQDVLNAKVDPNRYWKGQGVAQAATSIVGLILGSIGAANTGQNSVVPLIDKAIDRDIEAQKMELGKKQNFLSYMLQRGHDLQSGIQFRKAFMMDVFAAQLQSTAAKAESPIIRAKGEQLAAQLKIQGAQIRQQAALNDVQIASFNASRRLAEQQRRDAIEALAVPLPDGRTVYARDKDALKDVRDAADAYGQAKSNLDELLAFRKKYGAEKMPSEELAAAKVTAAMLQQNIRKLGAYGAHDKGAQEALNRILSLDPGEIGFEMARLKALDQSMARIFGAALRPRIYPMQAIQPGPSTLRKVGGP